MNSIRIFGKLYLREELINLKPHVFAMIQDDDEKEAVMFLHQWLSGEQQFVQQTSGSTGIPKPISISRSQMVHSAQLTGDFLHLEQLQYALLAISAKYIGGKMLLVRALMHDMQIDVVKPSNNFLNDLDTFHPYQLVSLVPSQLALIRESRQAKAVLNRFRTVLIGGASLPHTIEQELQQLDHVHIWQTYGMTETISHVALRKVNGNDRSDWYTPLPGIEIKTTEQDCLCIKAVVTGNEWLESRDVVELKGGKFKLLGRVDEVINSGGVKIFPSVVEAAVSVVLSAMDINCSFFAGALPDEKYGQKLVLVMEGPALSVTKTDELRQQLKLVLPAYQVPSAILFMQEFKMLPSGKLNKVSMLESFLKDS